MLIFIRSSADVDLFSIVAYLASSICIQVFSCIVGAFFLMVMHV